MLLNLSENCGKFMIIGKFLFNCLEFLMFKGVLIKLRGKIQVNKLKMFGEKLENLWKILDFFLENPGKIKEKCKNKFSLKPLQIPS